MVFNGKVSANSCHQRWTSPLPLTSAACLIGAAPALALCALNAIFTSSRQYNVPLLSLMNSVTACNCSYAYE